MGNITKNEMLFMLQIFKNPETGYNANSLAKHIRISSMGALKIAKKLEKDRVISFKQLGNAKFCRINFESDYAREYLKFLLKREAEQSDAYVKRWLVEIRKTKNADFAVLFGSVLRNKSEARDIDVLFITNQDKFSRLKKEISDINLLNDKKIHALFQSEEDFKKNIMKNEQVVLGAIKGIVAFGENKMIDLLRENESRRK